MWPGQKKMMMGRRWRRRTGHSAEGLQWGERKDVRGSICQPLSYVPAGFYLQLPACLLTLIEYPARPQQWTDPMRSSGSLRRLFILCPQTINSSPFKSLSVNRQSQNASSEKRNIMHYLLLFQEHWWNDRQRKTKVLEEKPVPVPLCPPQIPHGQARDRTMASVARSQRQITSVNGKVCCYCYHHHHHHHIA